MDTLEIIATVIAFTGSAGGLWFGLRSLIQSGFRDNAELGGRLLRGQEHLNTTVTKQEADFQRLTEEVRTNRERSNAIEQSLSDAIKSLVESNKETTKALTELRIQSSEEHSRQSALLERLIDRMDNQK